MAQVSMNTCLSAPAEDVWKVVRDFNGLTKFISAIVSSSTEGSGIGAVRTLTLEDGAQIIERLESLDDKNNRLSYSIVTSPLPLKDYLAIMKVSALDDSRCQVDWSSSFQPNGAPEDEVENILKGIYSMGFEGLQKLFES